MFANCSRYAPVVKEEELPGTVVIQVHAEDRDPPEEGGIVCVLLRERASNVVVNYACSKRKA